MNDIIKSPLITPDGNSDNEDEDDYDNYSNDNDNCTTTTNTNTNTTSNEINTLSPMDIIDSKQYDNDDNDYIDNQIKLKVEPKIAIVFLLLGIGNVFPYHSIMVSIDWLDYLFPTYKIASSFPFIYMICVCVTFLILIKFQNQIKQHLILLIQLPISMIIMILIPIININGISSNDSNSESIIIKYIFTLILIGFTAIIDGCCQGAIYSYAGLFGPQYTNYVQFGVGISGVIVLITKLICKLSFNSNDEYGLKIGSIVFFSISALVVFIAWLSFIYLLKLPISKKVILSKHLDQGGGASGGDEGMSTIASIKFIFKKCWQYLFIVFYTFFLLSLLYPSIIIQIEPISISDNWFIFIVISSYNISDCIGKMLPALIHSRWIPKLKLIWIVLLGRTIFIPIFFLAIYTNLFKSDICIIIFISLFGFTKGYCASYALSLGPKQIQLSFKPLTSILLQSSFNFGLLIGSIFNLIIVNIQ